MLKNSAWRLSCSSIDLIAPYSSLAQYWRPRLPTHHLHRRYWSVQRSFSHQRRSSCAQYSQLLPVPNSLRSTGQFPFKDRSCCRRTPAQGSQRVHRGQAETLVQELPWFDWWLWETCLGYFCHFQESLAICPQTNPFMVASPEKPPGQSHC